LILLGQDDNIPARKIIRKKVKSKYIPKRPEWDKMLRLIHKGILKYLSDNQIVAYDFLKEIKQGLIDIDIKDLDYNNEFISDITSFA